MQGTSNAGNDATDATISTTTSTTGPTISLSNTYIYGVGIVAVLAIGVCIFLQLIKISSCLE